MRRATTVAGAGAIAFAAALSVGAASFAADPKASDEPDLKRLQWLVDEQRKQIEAQERAIEDQRRRLQALEERLDAAGDPRVQPVVYDPLTGFPVERYRSQGIQPAQSTTSEETPTTTAPTTEPETPERPPEVTVLAERGGVLTPKGTLVLEPSIDWSKSTSNRLNFRGISIVEGFLVGIIEATDADRDTVTAQMTARLGVTDRLEVEVDVPYVYRNDRTTSLVRGTGGDFELTDEFDGHGLGDVEVGAHYQINSGRDDWPFFIGNLRYKSTTGDGPFDINRDGDGVPTEPATGSGFHGIEPSLTVLYPTDPAVLFANVGYMVNLPRDIDQTIGGTRIGEVDPGDSLSLSFGVGFALNNKLSLNLGYQHDFVDGTTSENDGVEVKSDDLSVGSFLFGGSYRLSDAVGLNMTVQIGATEDAPDARILFRVPVRFNLF